MKQVRLYNGVMMPAIGFGVYQIPPKETGRCVSDALEIGYRMIDTAQAYFNEEGVGNAIAKSGIDRKELFLTTKVWISNAGDEKAAKSIDESLRKLHTDYVDLLLIHQPFGDVFGTWRAMEKALADGKCRAIGVSNFQAGRFLDFCLHVEVKPMMNQLQCNPLMQQDNIQQYLNEFGTKMMAWGPLGGQGIEGVRESPVLAEIGKQYGKTASQVALRWLIQRGIVAIPKSTHKERMTQNFYIFDFALTEDDMKKIATLNEQDTGNVDFNDPTFVRSLINLKA